MLPRGIMPMHNVTRWIVARVPVQMKSAPVVPARSAHRCLGSALTVGTLAAFQIV
jgi:hypothetical protein